MPTARDHFWELWQRHREYLFHQSLRLMNGNQAEAEDALGAAMLRACDAFPRLASQIVDAKAWLGRVLHNICKDVYRRRRHSPNAPLESEDGASRSDAHEPSSPSPETLLLREEWEGHLQEHIYALPPHLREPFIMRFLRDMSYDDIASQLGLTNSNVRKRIQSSYRILRVALGAVPPAAGQAEQESPGSWGSGQVLIDGPSRPMG